MYRKRYVKGQKFLESGTTEKKQNSIKETKKNNEAFRNESIKKQSENSCKWRSRFFSNLGSSEPSKGASKPFLSHRTEKFLSGIFGVSDLFRKQNIMPNKSS